MPETITNTFIPISVNPLNPDTVYNDYERLSNIALSNYVNNIISKLNSQIETAAKSLQPLEASYIIADWSQEEPIIRMHWDNIKATIKNAYSKINDTSKIKDYKCEIEGNPENGDEKVTITLEITDNNSSN